MAKVSRRPVAVFHFKKLLSTGAFILKVRNVIKNMSDNSAIFVSPPIPLALATAHLDELVAAQAKALTRVQGGVSERDLKYKRVRKDLNSLLRYVQELADEANGELAAFVIIEAAGFSVKKHGAIVKPELAAKRGTGEGSIKLVARGAGKRNSHEWEMSRDQKTWIHLAATLKAKTEVKDLTRLSTMYFRHRVITKDGPLKWGFPVSTVVL